LAGGLASCSTIENLNPFGGEKYETKILPDVPADNIYDQGLARLQRRDHEAPRPSSRNWKSSSRSRNGRAAAC
jgi:hypothetical protein